MTERLPNADVRIAEWIRSVLGTPLVWGRSDCVSLALSGVRCMFPTAPFSGTIPTWTTRVGALRVLHRIGDPVEAMVSLGARRIPSTMCQSGDILAFDGWDDLGLPQFGLCSAGMLLTSTVDLGVIIAPLHLAERPHAALRWG